ncbi:fungal-specific transcription factor domain-containing protein [Mycena leptocephala]|nr:fungal-specific transcription factor domain-containing protein [Mycena leptocephala]
MSNDEQDAEGQSKKRRIQRACDICRRKKIRCDGAQMPGNRCSNCIAYSFECSYVEAAKKRGPPKGYVESMEIRIEKIERLLQTLLPEADLARVLSGTSVANRQVPPVINDDELAQITLTENLQQLSLNSDSETRFFGRSSGVMLLQTALKLKLDAEPQNARRHSEFWASRPSPEPIAPPQYNFPPPDLATSLVELYFTHINLLLPLLHRPTFARDLAAGLHLTNDGFAATFILVCAIGARFSSDPRVLLDGTDNLHSSGWRWFEQLQLMRNPLGPPPCLYDLQFSALSVIFLHGTSAPQACWTLVSIGIRMAQDVGAHRRKEATHQWTAEDELGKRAVWVLVFLDRVLSAHLGRPCTIQDEDFDLEFPIDCDDEYWEAPDPAQAFQQPKGKPSLISAFIAYLRLCQVISFTLRTIYSISKSKVLLGLSKSNTGDLESRIVAELDSALNQWIDQLPDHLRWNPTHENPEFFEQSAALYCSYYHLQIFIHRAYIPRPETMAPLAFPSFAICLNAARSCSRVADIRRQRAGDKPLPLSQLAVFTAAVVLLMNIWAGKRSGLSLSTDSGQEMAEVHRCMQVLRGCETRWQSAGKLWDILFELASVGQLPLPATINTNTSNKRERGAEEPKSAAAASSAESWHGSVSLDSGSSGTSSKTAPEPRVVVGLHRPIASNGSDFIASGDACSNSVPLGRPIAAALASLSARHSTFRLPLHAQQHNRFPILTDGDEALRHRSYPATPVSTSSLHHPEVSLPSMLREDSQRHGIARPHPLGPPDTPLSASSLRTHLHDRFVPLMHRSEESPHVRTHAQPETPVSASSIQSAPFIPSMNNGSATLRDFSRSRETLDDGRATSGRVWQARTTPSDHPGPSSVHVQHPQSSSNISDDINNPPRLATGFSSFPISEAFYEHLTESFSSPPPDERSYHRMPHPPPDSYADQAHHAYADSGTRASGTEQCSGRLDDWNSYLNTVNEITQARMHEGADVQ